MSDSSRRHPAIQILVDLVADLRKTDGTLAKLEEAWPRLDAGEGDRGDELPFWTSFHDEVLQKAENLAKKQNVIRSDTVSQGVLSFLQRLPELVESEASEFADPDEPGTLDVVLRAVQQEIEVLDALAKRTWPLESGRDEERPLSVSKSCITSEERTGRDRMMEDVRDRLKGQSRRLFHVLCDAAGKWVTIDELFDAAVFYTDSPNNDTLRKASDRLRDKLETLGYGHIFQVSCEPASERIKLNIRGGTENQK